MAITYEDTSQEQPPFTPIFGDRGGFDSFAEIEAGVREALPSAPRLLQILIAGSALVNSEGDDNRFFRGGEGPELARKRAAEEAEELIAARYSTPEAQPYKQVCPFPGAENEAEAARREFWKVVGSYARMLLHEQPLFITEDIVGEGTIRSFTQPPIAEPVRDPDAHPKPFISTEERHGALEAARAAQKAFWETAEVSTWDAKASELDLQMQQGKINVLSGPRGTGKSNQLLPALQTLAETRGNTVIRMTRLGPVRLMEEAITHKGKPITLLMDEPDNTSFTATVELLKDMRAHGYNIEATIIIGAVDDRRQRVEFSKHGYVDKIQQAGLRVNYEELQETPLITEATIKRWGETVGAEYALVSLIIRQPFLRIPRIFDALFHGIVLAPHYDPSVSDKDDFNNYVYPINMLQRIYETALRSERNPYRPVYQPRTVAELKGMALTVELPLDIQQPSRYWIHMLAAGSGANKNESYSHYLYFCKFLGIEAEPEEQLGSNQPQFFN